MCTKSRCSYCYPPSDRAKKINPNPADLVFAAGPQDCATSPDFHDVVAFLCLYRLDGALCYVTSGWVCLKISLFRRLMCADSSVAGRNYKTVVSTSSFKGRKDDLRALGRLTSENIGFLSHPQPKSPHGELGTVPRLNGEVTLWVKSQEGYELCASILSTDHDDRGRRLHEAGAFNSMGTDGSSLFRPQWLDARLLVGLPYRQCRV